MKNKRISKILGIGLSAGLIFALIGALFAAPVAADEMKWTTVNTPSWEDNVIVPGSDIAHYDIGGDDGDRVVAVGAINGSDDCIPERTSQGLTGDFYISSGSLTITGLTSTTAEISITGDGSGCFLGGDFTLVANVQHDSDFGWLYTGNDAWLAGSGQITYDDPSANNDAEITFSGTLYVTGGDSLPADGTHSLSDELVCVADWNILPATLGQLEINSGQFTEPRVWMSDDGGVTWSDITSTVQDAANLPGPFVQFDYGGVAIATDDEDWLVVSGGIFHPDFIGFSDGDGLGLDSGFIMSRGVPATVASQDGADNFSYAGDMEDASEGTWMALIYDVDVSIETDDGIHIVAVAGINTPDMASWFDMNDELGSVYRLDAGTWLAGSWEDTTGYLGWDEFVGPDSSWATWGVVDGEFSTNFDLDDTYVCIGASVDTDGGDPGTVPYVQMGLFESGTWNGEAAFPDAVKIENDGEALWSGVALYNMALALPDSYDGTDPGARSLFLYVDAYNTVSGLVRGFVFRLDNSALSPTCGPSGDPLLASMDVYGDADTGKMMVGEYIKWDDNDLSYGDIGSPQRFECCEGVRVWHTEELDFCCPLWDGACKNPSGTYAAQVKYTPDGAKEYATTGTIDYEYYGIFSGAMFDLIGGLFDETAFSVSRDDAVSFNQLGLIDTHIDYLSDVAVCPDCGTIYLSTINEGGWCEACCEEFPIGPVCACDSIWRSYDDGDTWERVNHGDWSDSYDDQLLLRLPCDAIEDCCDQDPAAPMGTIYLGLQNTDEVFYSRDCGQCWNNPPSTKEDIQDIAVESENIVYVLDADGGVSKSTQYGRRWSDPVDTEIGSGHTIASCCEEGFVVVGGDSAGKVAWSDDGGESFTLTDALPSAASGYVHVACDPVCENIIYAAVSGSGIFRTDITDGAWDDLEPLSYEYSGIVLAREGTLYASTADITVDTDGDNTALLTDCKGRDLVAPNSDSDDLHYSGVARNLTPCETDCCGTEDWDYLFCGMSDQDVMPLQGEWFNNEPSALRICGCLSAATNSVLYAIDWNNYDVSDGSDGTLWSYEDCAAKAGPTLTAPADEAVLDCEACAGCGAAPFTLEWERMCEACSYDVNIMDEDGNLIIELVDQEITGDPPELYLDPEAGELKIEITGTTVTITSMGGDSLECGNTYTWKVREANTDCECVHSPWSETWSFTIAVGTADAIKLLAPDEGALGVPIGNVGFSWTSVPDASSYSFVLSPNAALTGALVSQDLSSTAFNFAGPLDYGKAYYWQVKAWKDGILLTTSAIGVFNTGSKPVAPTPPVVVEPTPAPIVQIPPAEQITPTWIYAIIGIGAALAVVVIVLIVRTRRP